MFPDGRAELAPGFTEDTDISNKDRVTWTNTIIDNYRQEVKPVEEVIRRWGDVSGYVPGEMNGSQQRQLVVNYAKMLDPSSAVMENEASAVANAGIAFPLLTEYYRMAVNNSLTKEKQQTILDEMKALGKSRYDELTSTYDKYREQFEAIGIDPQPYLRLPDVPGLSSGLTDEERDELRRLRREQGGR